MIYRIFFYKTMAASFRAYNFELCIRITDSYVEQRAISFLFIF